MTTQIGYDDETADGALIVVKIRHNKSKMILPKQCDRRPGGPFQLTVVNTPNVRGA